MRFEAACEGWTEAPDPDRCGPVAGHMPPHLSPHPQSLGRLGGHRYEAAGLAGLLDKRPAQVSHRRAPVDEVMRLVDRYRNPSAGSGTTGARAGMCSTTPPGISARAVHRFCSLYTDRGSHDWHTPEAGGKVGKANPTPFGRALAQLGIWMIPAYSPEARGRSERAFRSHQARLVREQFERTVRQDNGVPFEGLILPIPADRRRCHDIKRQVKVSRHADGALSVHHGPRMLAR